ncbi:acetyl-CoA carboxylase biotin carboxyl carrier protein [Caproiciproducens faecalis]|uniref:Biotin carboxyl carrier protein of acetyl-CoA carboxylase n=1 Tax=Caproiciproducens faecalis TaxID=2820301 RepID=A0ABS7DQA5_9FIRM|nr:acetyl-CoA carboxylase biotin carboxyl carrier protein [Caproiciproducens faecalis]MBW7573005.1 acetyl-CoA carboxylase biotin carboxyl carrier protein [Caproiciproducens faecalis]
MERTGFGLDIQQIKELAHTMRENGLTLVEITGDGTSLRLERGSVPAEAALSVPAAVQAPEKQEAAPAPAKECGGVEVKSPIVGVFYAAASLDSEPYVQVGSRVKKGDTLCIIEAMKLLNEITAECDGEVTEVCAASGQVVEYAQVLFRIK